MAICERLADIVVQVRGDRRSHAFQVYGLRHPVTMARQNRRGNQYQGQALKPPALPHGRQHDELDLGRHRAFRAPRGDRLHQKTVLPGRQRRVVDRVLAARRAPVPIRALERVRVAEEVPRFVVDAHKFDLELILRRIQFQPGDARGPHLRERIGRAADPQSGAGHTRRLYGPGVLDVSRFNYMYRQCRNSTTHTDEGYQSVSWMPVAAGQTADSVVLDGPIISDCDYYATDRLSSATVNNTKIVGWNGNNDGFQFGLTAYASNVFVRTGDDSLKMWGSYITVTNATVWQNWNGGVVNLGWADNTPGDDCVIDGVYVVKTDWRVPTEPSFSATTLSGANNAIVASLMVPTTKFGTLIPSVYRNIYVEDAPRVLFRLKILPPDCELVGQVSCPVVDLTQPGILNLNIENVFTPASLVGNSIGFQTVNGSPLGHGSGGRDRGAARGRHAAAD